MNTKRPILVTGAAGFIGSTLVKKLVLGGYAVTALVREKTDLRRLQGIRSKIEFVYADIEDGENLKKKIEEIRPSGIFHLAVSNMKSGITAPHAEVVRVNMLGTVNVIDAANGIDYDFLIHTGSFLEYGARDRAVKETDCTDPPELYSITKLASTLYGARIGKMSNKPILTFRVFTPYGPEVHEGRFVYDVLSHAQKGEDIVLTNPAVSRDFIYVDDVVDLLMEGMGKARAYHGEVFNAGSGRSTTLGEVVQILLEITSSKSKVIWGKPLIVYDAMLWRADMAKTFSSFTWRPKTGIKEGLKKTAEWLKNP